MKVYFSTEEYDDWKHIFVYNFIDDDKSVSIHHLFMIGLAYIFVFPFCLMCMIKVKF